MKKNFFGLVILFSVLSNTFSQDIKGIIHGEIVDVNSESAIPPASPPIPAVPAAPNIASARQVLA